MQWHLKERYLSIVILNQELDEVIIVNEALELGSVRVQNANVVEILFIHLLEAFLD